MKKSLVPSLLFSLAYALVVLWMAWSMWGWRGAVLAFAILGYIRAELVRSKREDD